MTRLVLLFSTTGGALSLCIVFTSHDIFDVVNMVWSDVAKTSLHPFPKFLGERNGLSKVALGADVPSVSYQVENCRNKVWMIGSMSSLQYFE